MTAEQYYQEGNAWRKQGDFKRALDCYMEAIALDPESPAVAAKEMLDNIMSFYCKDYYNPWFGQREATGRLLSVEILESIWS